MSAAEVAAGDENYRCLCLKNWAANGITNVKAYLVQLGTQQTSDAGQLGASGAGTIQTTGSVADWPEAGWCKIMTSGGSEREIVYYTSRTGTTLTVPAAGRELRGTTAAAGAATDTIHAIPSIDLGKEAPSSQPAGNFTDKTGAGEGSAPGGVSFSAPIVAAEYVDIGDLAAGYIYGLWLRRLTPTCMQSGIDISNRLSIGFDAG